MFAAGYSVSEDQMLNDVNEIDNVHIPTDLLPVFTLPKPWPTSPNFENDFIMIAEFCEIEGPNPLLIIPSDGGGNFNKEQFAVNIMSVDYNATNSTRAASGSFIIYDDTCLLQQELSEGAHAYVHHFILYDIYARGFVRPFCIAYITPEKSKLVNHFEMIMNKCRKITEAFKYGNIQNFCEDLERKLLDLAFTKENHVSKLQHLTNSPKNNENEEKIKKNYTKLMEELEKAIDETTEILCQFRGLKVDKRLERRFKKMEASVSHRRQRVHSQSASLHGDGYYSDSGEMQKHFEIRKCQSNEILDGGRDSKYQPKLIKVDGYRKFDINLRTLQELCQWGAKIGMSKLKRFYKHFSRRSEVLSIEKIESKMVKPSSSLLTIGRTVTVNFIPDNYVQCCRSALCHLNLNSLCKTCNVPDRLSLMTCSSANTVGPLTDDEDMFGFLPSSFETKFISGSPFASTESLYYDASDVHSVNNSSSDDSSDCNEDWVEIRDSSSYRSSSPNRDSGCVDKHSNTSLGSGGPLSTNCKSQVEDDVKDESQLYDSCEDSIELDSAVQSDTERSSHVNERLYHIKSQAELIIRCSSGTSIDQLLNVPLDSIPAVGRVPVGCYASWISSNTLRFPGCRLKKFLNQYSFAIHLVYALFSGRTVVVTGHPNHQREIKALIVTLSLLIPGYSSYSQILPWYTKPITIADVGRMKLVGLSKEGSLHRAIPSVVRNYVSIFDFDKQVLYTPSYQGTYLQTLITQCCLLRNDVSFIAYVQTVFLEMASKAFVYYHAYCLAHHHTKQSDQHRNSAEEKKTINTFLSKLGIVDGDAHIVMYWTELIKQQQLLGMNSNSRCSSLPLQSIHLDYRISSKFSSNTS